MSFGRAPGRRPPLPTWANEALAYAGLTAGICVLPGLIAFTTWSEVETLRREWTVAGPPCAVVQAPSRLAVGHKAPMSFDYGGARFTRSFGAADCAAIPERGLLTRANDHICQFNNPGAVTVQLAGRSTIFEPPPGRRATVTVREGGARCVVGGWFNL